MTHSDLEDARLRHAAEKEKWVKELVSLQSQLSNVDSEVARKAHKYRIEEGAKRLDLKMEVARSQKEMEARLQEVEREKQVLQERIRVDAEAFERVRENDRKALMIDFRKEFNDMSVQHEARTRELERDYREQVDELRTQLIQLLSHSSLMSGEQNQNRHLLPDTTDTALPGTSCIGKMSKPTRGSTGSGGKKHSRRSSQDEVGGPGRPRRGSLQSQHEESSTPTSSITTSMLKELQGTLSVTQEKLSDREDEVLNLRQALQETTDTQQRRILELERLLELATMQTPTEVGISESNRDQSGSKTSADNMGASAVVERVPSAPEQLQPSLSSGSTPVDNGDEGTAGSFPRRPSAALKRQASDPCLLEGGTRPPKGSRQRGEAVSRRSRPSSASGGDSPPALGNRPASTGVDRRQDSETTSSMPLPKSAAGDLIRHPHEVSAVEIGGPRSGLAAMNRPLRRAVRSENPSPIRAKTHGHFGSSTTAAARGAQRERSGVAQPDTRGVQQGPSPLFVYDESASDGALPSQLLQQLSQGHLAKAGRVFHQDADPSSLKVAGKNPAAGREEWRPKPALDRRVMEVLERQQDRQSKVMGGEVPPVVPKRLSSAPSTSASSATTAGGKKGGSSSSATREFVPFVQDSRHEKDTC